MILVWLIVIPFVGGLLCWQGERRAGPWLPRWLAAGSMLTVLCISLWLWATGDYNLGITGGAPQWAVEFRHDWIPRFGISFHLALDGLSLMLVVLTALLGLMAVICSWREIDQRVGFFHLNLLWNLGAVIGVFLTLDLFLFFFLWEAMLVPMYFLIALWGHNAPGGRGRIYAATKFFLFTQASGLIMLVAILGLVYVHQQQTGVLTFNYMDLLGTSMSPLTEFWLMLGFFVAFAVKMPTVPLHSWLPEAHSQAPTAGSVDLAGILLKTAAYGLLRFALPLFPNASLEFAPVAMWLGVIGVIYGGVLTFAQNDIKRLVAYSSVAHMGFVMIGIYAGTEMALQGVTIQLLAHGISAGGLFILCGEIYERMHTRDMRKMGGLWARLKTLPPIAMVFAVASLGLPGFGNFIGEFLILAGTWELAPAVTIVASAGLVLAAVYCLILIQRSFHGPVQGDAASLRDLSSRERYMLLSLVAVLIWLGLYPQPFLNTSTITMQAIHEIYRGAAAAIPGAGAP